MCKAVRSNLYYFKSNCRGSKLREAHEEIALPLPPHPAIHILTTLPAHISPYKLLVTPVVAYISDPVAVLPTLKASPNEVDEIFDWKLEAFLDPTLAAQGSKYEVKDIPWVGDQIWREHIFHAPAQTLSDGNARPDPPSAIKGITADILVGCHCISLHRPLDASRLRRFQSRFSLLKSHMLGPLLMSVTHLDSRAKPSFSHPPRTRKPNGWA